MVDLMDVRKVTLMVVLKELVSVWKMAHKKVVLLVVCMVEMKEYLMVTKKAEK